VAQAAAEATEALRREAKAELPAFVARLYASDQGVGAKAVMRALAERGGWGAMATKVAAQDALQRLRGGAAEGVAVAAARVHEAREAAAAAAEALRREAEAELPGFVATLWGANKEVGTKAAMRALAQRGGWGGVVKKAAVQDALHGLRNAAALRQLEEARSLEDPSEELLELLREAERFFDGGRPKLTRRIAGLEAWMAERRQAAAAELAARRRAAEDAERALRTEEEEAASLLAARAEAEALAAPVVRGTGGAAVEAEAQEVDPRYELVAELLGRLELVEYLPLCLENELEDGALYSGTSLESVYIIVCLRTIWNAAWAVYCGVR
jgi:hypothetical protein